LSGAGANLGSERGRGALTDKQDVRERAWDLLERGRFARFPGARGRIPNFAGAESAADRLFSEREWRRAGVIKSNPDAPQLPVRAGALGEGKLLVMAMPRLRAARPFLLLDPARIEVPPRRAASIKGATRGGRPVAIDDIPHVDLIVCGSVAVNRRGARVGKGGGYSDLEFALLTEAGRVDDRTVIATTVHPVQIFDYDLPETEHDFRVDLIVTPEETIRPRPEDRRRPQGLIWTHLDEHQIGAIPVLAEIARTRGG
jgi:5-formyltetrahydrofolate cyclo-ligase